VVPAPEARLLEDGWAYFANSFRWTDVPEGWQAALSDHGGPFVAAVERGRVLACQFHPELSGSWGQDLLQRWLGTARSGRKEDVGESSGSAPGEEEATW